MCFDGVVIFEGASVFGDESSEKRRLIRMLIQSVFGSQLVIDY